MDIASTSVWFDGTKRDYALGAASKAWLETSCLPSTLAMVRKCLELERLFGINIYYKSLNFLKVLFFFVSRGTNHIALH